MPLPRTATAAPTVWVDTKRTLGAWPWPGGIRRERTNDNRDRFYLTRRGPCLRLVKQALLIYLGQVAREQENTCCEPSIGTYSGGIASHTYMLWVEP